MTDAKRAYRAICFDLDGTLLPMDIDEFMAAYFKRIGSFMAQQGYDAAAFMEALKRGTHAMALHDDDHTNEEAFWEAFFVSFEEAQGRPLTDGERERMRQKADEFYATDFAHIGDGFTPNPLSSQIVEALREKGYPLVLATMPMFPRQAVKHRLAWAGVDPQAFDRITSYENSKSIKPKQTYFAEVLAAIGVPGNEVLMVGNNTMEDFACTDLGMDGYLVTDHLLNPISMDINQMRNGSLAELATWVAELPSCASPAQGIATGPIPHAKTEQTLVENAVIPIDQEAALRKAAAVVGAVVSDHEPGEAASLRVEP